MAKFPSPSKETIRELRLSAGLTQTQAATLLHTVLRTYQQWEYGEADMHPAFFELFQLKIQLLGAVRKDKEKGAS